MSLKKRFKKGLRNISAALGSGSLAGLAMSKKDKKKKLLEGMRKATGQSATQAAKIKRRTDIAAKRKSAQRKDRNKAYVDAVTTGFAAAKTSGLMKKEKK